MMPVLYRELRENLKWAAIICAALLVLFGHEIRTAGPMFIYDLTRETIVFAPLAGVLLGVLQMLFETRQDNWGFVVHRPLSRVRIFIAKSAAGLILLFTSLLVPCGLAWMWAARPGNLAIPIQPRMTLPMVADVLNSGGYYFAGMLLTLRRARWFGTRLLPVGLPLAASAIIFMFVPEFWQAALLSAFIALIGAVAAAGIFSSQGAGPMSTLQHAALGAMIYPGAMGVLLGFMGFSQTFSTVGHWQYYQVDRNGNLVRETLSINHGERSTQLTDAAGKPMPEYAGIDPDDPANANLFIRFNTHLFDPKIVPWPLTTIMTGQSYRAPDNSVVSLRPNSRNVRLPFSAWYDISQRMIVLYDPVSKLQIGSTGPAGFAPAKVEATSRFPDSPINLFLQRGNRALAFDSIVYWIELDQRRVRPIFTTPADDPVMSAGELGSAASPLVLIATRHRLYGLHSNGQQQFTIPLPFDPAQSTCDAALLPGNSHLILQTYGVPGNFSAGHQIMEYSTDGTLLKRTHVPSIVGSDQKKYESAALAAIFPVAVRPLIATWVVDDVVDVRLGDFPKLFAGLMWAGAVVCAIFTILIARRTGLTWAKTIAWTLGNLLLGFAGLLTMLGIVEWPARERCATCAQNRFVGRPKCSACGASWEAEPADGREIFEPDRVLQPI